MKTISLRLFSKDFDAVYEKDPISKCLEKFKRNLPPVLAVLDKNDKYVGVIARRWIVRSRLDIASTKVKTLTRKAPRVSPEFSPSKVAKLMIQSDIRQLPVFQKNQLIGFVTDENVIHSVIIEEWGNTPIEKIMTKAPKTIDADRTIGATLTLMREEGISHIPVLFSGKLVGILSIQDILDHVFQPPNRQTKGEIAGEKAPLVNLPAKGIMTKPVITVPPETTLKEAIEKMHKHNISCLVVTKKEKLVGITTKLDFLEPISQMEPTQRKIAIEFGIKGIAINPDQQTFIMEEFETFIRKFQEALESGTLFVYIKTHGSNHKGVPLIHCRLQLRSVKGAFFSSGEGYGVEPTFRIALDRLDKRLLRSKELAYNPKYAKDYLNQIGIMREEP